MVGAGMACIVAAWFPGEARAQSTTHYPVPVDEDAGELDPLINQATGYIRTHIGPIDSESTSWWRGSASVVRHPQLLYSAAHVLQPDGTWIPASDIEFHRALHREDSPPYGDVFPRGYLHFTEYSGGNDEDSFDWDFTIMYGNNSFGPAAPYFSTNGTEMVESNHLKKIVGYPSVIDAWEVGDERREGHYLQHHTLPFELRGKRFQDDNHQDRERYSYFFDVSTGGGNSGGPVYVQDGNGEYGLAAILVSGNKLLAGVHALDEATHSMGNDALSQVEFAPPRVTKRFQHRRKFRLPPGRKGFRKRRVHAQGFHGNVSTLRFRTVFKNRARKKLEVYLKAPSGRFRWIVRGKKGRRKKLKINRDYSASFRGASANGTWRLYMRDPEKEKGKRSKRAVYRMFSLTIGD